MQIVPTIAHTAESVTVFQCTPNYVLPSRNHKLTDAELDEIKRTYDDVWAQVRQQFLAMPIPSAGRVVAEASPAQRQQIFDPGWETGGFRFLFETFDDVFVSQESNELACEFVRNKIRAIVKDPATAELLCPRYPIGVKRPPLGQYSLPPHCHGQQSRCVDSTTPTAPAGG